MDTILNSKKFNSAWNMLWLTYAVVPIVIGLDKCFGWWLVNWAQYASPIIVDQLPISMHQFVILTGIIEIIAGLIVFVRPRLGAYIVAAWLVAVVINLATMNKFYDIMARDLVIAIGVLAFAWLTELKESARSR